VSDTVLALLTPLVGYLAGSILPAELVARRHGARLRDIDKDRNPGTSEIYRLYGLAPALLVFVLDAVKGILPVAAAQWLGVPWWSVTLTAVAAVAGHCWSLYYRFWGGKGLATATGILALMMPLTVLAVLPPSLFAWWRTRWVPVSGMVGLPIILAVAWLYDDDPAHKATATIIPLVMLIRQMGWITEQLTARRAPGAPPAAAGHPEVLRMDESKESSSA